MSGIICATFCFKASQIYPNFFEVCIYTSDFQGPLNTKICTLHSYDVSVLISTIMLLSQVLVKAGWSVFNKRNQVHALPCPLHYQRTLWLLCLDSSIKIYIGWTTFCIHMKIKLTQLQCFNALF